MECHHPKLKMSQHPSTMAGYSCPTSHLYLELFLQTPSLENSKPFSTYQSYMQSARESCHLELCQTQRKEFQGCHKCEYTSLSMYLAHFFHLKHTADPYLVWGSSSSHLVREESSRALWLSVQNNSLFRNISGRSPHFLASFTPASILAP